MIRTVKIKISGMKANQIICMLFLATVLISCNSDDINMEKYATFGIPELAHPDSVLTKEQLKTKRKLQEIICTNLGVKDNKIVFMSRNEFLKEGLSESYYNQMIKCLNELNDLSRDTTCRQQILEHIPVAMAKMKEALQKFPQLE
jgi:hypothetical protein